MNRSNLTPLIPLDEDINRTLRFLALEKEQAEARKRRSEEGGQHVGAEVEGIEREVEVEMAANQPQAANPTPNANAEAEAEEEPRTMGYYMAPRAADIQLPILHPPVAANNFEIKPSIVSMIQQNAYFHGLSHESPREHVQRFLELARSLKINNVSEEALQLKLFPYSLAGKALRWLNNRPALSITSWDDLLNKFMTHYCPPSKTAEWRKKITHFEQEDYETLRDAWERFSDYFLQCLHHGFEEKFRIETFYGGNSNILMILIIL
ncbi:unnamed protein product [Linum trigynum]|uniref:Retrotransposon gag domain-containing protein n=1 Tax=Linum trigynum TaxID=586398 RepID=A0AAV2FD62_9ROSI